MRFSSELYSGIFTGKQTTGELYVSGFEGISLAFADVEELFTQQKETAFVMNHSAYLKQKQEFHRSIARYNRTMKQGKEVYIEVSALLRQYLQNFIF